MEEYVLVSKKGYSRKKKKRKEKSKFCLRKSEFWLSVVHAWDQHVQGKSLSVS